MYTIERTVEFDKEYVCIKIPVQELIDRQFDREDISFEIVKKDEMIDEIVDYFKKTFDFSKILDEFFEKAYENGKVWLKGNWNLNPVFPKSGWTTKGGKKINS